MYVSFFICSSFWKSFLPHRNCQRFAFSVLSFAWFFSHSVMLSRRLSRLRKTNKKGSLWESIRIAWVGIAITPTTTFCCFPLEHFRKQRKYNLHKTEANVYLNDVSEALFVRNSIPRCFAVKTSRSIFSYWKKRYYENIIIGAIKCNTSDLELRKGKTKVGKQGVRSLHLFEITKLKYNSDLEYLISFSVIHRFIGLCHKITEICSINRKHRSNWTVTLTYK